MTPFRNLPIRRKLRWVFLATSGLALLLATSALLVLEIVTYRQQLVDTTSMQAGLVGYNAAPALAFNDRKAAEETLRALRVDRQILAATVFARGGEIFARYLRDGSTPGSVPAPPDGEARRWRFVGDRLVVDEPIALDGERLGTVRVVASLERVYELAGRYAAAVVAVFVLSLALVLPVVNRLQRVIATPIAELVDKATRVSAEKDYAVRASRTTSDELGVLVDAFNEMLSEIQRRDADLQRARDVAESANRAKDEFLAVVSHELRTPLTSILTWARMQQNGALPTAEVQRGAQIIERNARSQAQIIDDLLDLSRITAGKLALDVSLVDVAPVVEACVEAIRPTAEIKGVELQATIDPKAMLVLGDAERLRQVFVNLLSNAVKFTARGGRVQVAVRREDSRAVVTVSDTGKGLAPELLPHVFERFWQADTTTTRVHGGLGLGLSIARHLVELHGGTIEARSPGEGLGATFSVEIPLSARASDGKERVVPALGSVDVPQASALEGVEVLAVDDDEDTLETLRTLLARHGARVRGVRSAQQALAALATRRADVIVSDIGMPETNGYQLIRLVRDLPLAAGGRTPALALTAFARADDRMRALAAGFQMHLAKPIEPDELVAVVSSLAKWRLREPV